MAGICRADEIAVFYALEADGRALAQSSEVARQPVRVGQRSISIYQIAGHKVYAVKMESGVVETAVSAEALLSRFSVDFALSLGPIGGLTSDIVLQKWYTVQSIVPYQKGMHRESGFQSAEPITLRALDILDESELPPLFRDAPLISVASGEVFIASSSFREQLAAQTKASAVDMNLFGLYAACRNHQVPLLAWRICSDNADPSASDDFRAFVEKYDGAGGRMLSELIKLLPPNKQSPEAYDNLRKLLME